METVSSSSFSLLPSLLQSHQKRKRLWRECPKMIGKCSRKETGGVCLLLHLVKSLECLCRSHEGFVAKSLGMLWEVFGKNRKAIEPTQNFLLTELLCEPSVILLHPLGLTHLRNFLNPKEFRDLLKVLNTRRRLLVWLEWKAFERSHVLFLMLEESFSYFTDFPFLRIKFLFVFQLTELFLHFLSFKDLPSRSLR